MLFWRALKVWHCKVRINYKYHSTVNFHFSQSVIYELQRHHCSDVTLSYENQVLPETAKVVNNLALL